MPYGVPYRPALQVLVNGQPVVALTATVTVGQRAPIAVASVAFAVATAVAPGDAIEVRQGLGELVTTFKGEVPEDGITYWPNRIDAQAQGPLAHATLPIGVDPLDDAALVDPITGEPLPALAYAGETDGAIVKHLLDEVGVRYDSSGIAEAGVILGVLQPVTLGRKQSPLQLIQQIDEAYGYLTYDGPDGLVRRVPASGLPPAATLVLEEGVSLGVSTKRGQSIRDVRNRANVTGAESDGIVIRATAQSASRASPRTGQPYIPTPPEFAAYTFSSPLLETYDACLAHATAAVGRLNRIQESVSVALVRGNPRIQPGAGVAVVSAKLGFDATNAFRVEEVRHESSAAAYHTSLALAGGYAAEGQDPNKRPVPAFTVTVLVEYLDGVPVWVVMADASSSTDPDGAYLIPATDTGAPEQTFNGIARYTWASTLGVTPALSPATVNEVGGMRATWVCSTSPVGQSITLTVMDYQGATASLTQVIRSGTTSPLLVRDLWAAVESETLFSDDGEQTWQHIAVPSVALAPQAAEGFQLAAGVGGALYRISVSGSFTTPASAPTNVTCCYIRWKFPETTIPGDRCWLGTANGEVWFSPDFGQTWFHKATLPGNPIITHIEESPFTENNLAVTAGPTLWGSYDGVAYFAAYTHPNALLQATSYAAGFSHAFVGFAGTPPVSDPAAEASRVQERTNQITGNWAKTSTTITLPAGTYKVQASYLAYTGSSPASAQATVVLPAGRVIEVASLIPLPQGAYGVALYVSVAGGSVARFIGIMAGDTPFVIDHVDPTGVAAPVVGTTLRPFAAPPAPSISATLPVSQPVDFPADLRALTIGMYHAILMAVGDLPSGGDSVSWWADATQDFTFRRGAYNFAALGRARHIIRDGFVDGVVYGAAQLALFKSTSYLRDDCRVMLTLSGGQTGRMIAYGALHPAALAGPTTIVSDASARAISLWSGGGNDAPPAHWTELGFDDSGWPLAFVGTHTSGPTVAIAGSWTLSVRASGLAAAAGEQTLYRQRFTLPAGAIRSATFTFRADDLQQGAWINGHYLGQELTATPFPVTDLGPDLVVSVDPAFLHAGGENVIAVWVTDAAPLGNSGTPTFATYKLEVV